MRTRCSEELRAAPSDWSKLRQLIRGSTPFDRQKDPGPVACRLMHVWAVVKQGVKPMLWTIFVVLMVLWLAGVTTSYTLGGFIHILLLLAIASVLIQIIQGRRVV
jgi:hypothetical protein